MTAPRTRRERSHSAESSPKCAATLSLAASTSTESAGTAPSIPRNWRSVASRSRGPLFLARPRAVKAYPAARMSGRSGWMAAGNVWRWRPISSITSVIAAV